MEKHTITGNRNKPLRGRFISPESNKIAQKTSYELAFLTTRAKKDYSITENLIIPGALIIAENMLGGAAVNAIKSIPFSDTTMARRIEEMACDVSQQVIEKIKQDKRFALQLDESTDISNQAQDITTFDSLSNLIIENEVVLTGRVMVIISNHLTILANTFLKYFPEIDLKDLTNTWITNPFATQAISEANLSNKLKENLLELSVDSSHEIYFTQHALCQFWTFASLEYKNISNVAITQLLPFHSTYLCEQGFSALTTIKTKLRNRLDPEPSLTLALTNIRPRISQILELKQHHSSIRFKNTFRL